MQRSKALRNSERLSTVVLAAVVLVPLFACGGNAKKDSYRKAVGEQERCCQGLQDDRARAECNQAIVRVSDPAAESSDVNDATFRCVERNFVCDPQTGRATKEASQKAYDCITDLGS